MNLTLPRDQVPLVLQVRPFPCQDLAGWRIRCMAFGNESFLITADANKEPRRPWLEGCDSVPHVITVILLVVDALLVRNSAMHVVS
jgi:hypothetical protein